MTDLSSVFLRPGRSKERPGLFDVPREKAEKACVSMLADLSGMDYNWSAEKLRRNAALLPGRPCSPRGLFRDVARKKETL